MRFLEKVRNKTYRFLRWSEQYTKTDMVYLTKSGSWMTLGDIIASGSVFLLATAFANLLPKETYGTYKYVLSIVAMLSVFTLRGMGTAVTRAVAKGYESSFFPALKTRIKWGLLGGVTSIGVAGYYWLNGNTELMISFLIAAIFIPVMDSFQLWNPLLQGRKRFDLSTKYQIANKVGASGVMIATVFLSNNLFIILLSYFASHTLLRLLFLKITLSTLKKDSSSEEGTITYGKHLSLMKGFSTVASNIDNLLLFHYLGAAEVAIYSFAVAPLMQLKGPFQSLRSLIIPKFSERDEGEIRAGMESKFIRLFLLNAFLVTVYIVTAPYIFEIFFPEYTNSVFFSQIFALSLLAGSFSPAGNFLTAKKKVREKYISSVITPAVQVILMVVFVLWQGILGLVIARTLHRFFGAFLNLFLYYTSD